MISRDNITSADDHDNLSNKLKNNILKLDDELDITELLASALRYNGFNV